MFIDSSLSADSAHLVSAHISDSNSEAGETAPYKHPRKIEFVPSLDPVKTISGKTKRKVLRLSEYGEEQKRVSGVEFIVKPLREAA